MLNSKAYKLYALDDQGLILGRTRILVINELLRMSRYQNNNRHIQEPHYKHTYKHNYNHSPNPRFIFSKNNSHISFIHISLSPTSITHKHYILILTFYN